MNSSDFRILEGLRGLAAMAVVLNHARGNLFIGGFNHLSLHSGWRDWAAVCMMQVTSLGPQAVIVFFVLSGFSIAHAVAHSQSCWSFYARRAVRLYPPYIGGLVLAWFVVSLYQSINIENWQGLRTVFETPQALVRNLLYIKTGDFVPQYWSLVHEVIFYALAPALALRRFRYHFLLAAYGLYVLGCLLPGNGERAIVPAFLMDYALFFAVGVVAYHDRARIAPLFTMQRRPFLVLCAVAYCAIAAMLRLSEEASFLMAAGFSLLLIFNFLHHDFQAPGLKALGSMSYTIYVTHFAALMLWGFFAYKSGWVTALPDASLWFWATSIPAVLLVAAVFHVALERPASRALKRARAGRMASGLRTWPR